MLGTTFPAQSAKLIDVEIQHKNPFECLYNPELECRIRATKKLIQKTFHYL